MLNLLINSNKNYDKNYNLIKKKLYCYKNLEFRLIKTKISMVSKFLIIDFKLKSDFYFIQQTKFYKKKSNLVNLYLINKDKIFNFVENFSSKKLNKIFYIYFFFKQIFLSKNFVKGRVLNFLKNGFIVGLNGAICFLPVGNCLYVSFNTGKLNIFFISFFNEKEYKNVVLSQRNIYKKLNYALLKMASRILFKDK